MPDIYYYVHLIVCIHCLNRAEGGGDGGRVAIKSQIPLGNDSDKTILYFFYLKSFQIRRELFFNC